MRQPRMFVVALVGLVLLCQACGGVESSSSVSAVDDRPLVSVVSSDMDIIPEMVSGMEGRSSGIMTRRSVSYLEEVIPPSVPIEGSEVDPCLPPTLPQAEGLIQVTTTALTKLSSYIDLLMNRGFSPRWIPHIVIRGTGKSDTSRCALYPVELFNYELDGSTEYRSPEYYANASLYLCFMDIRVNEYIVGQGPADLTVQMYIYRFLDLDLEDWPTLELEHYAEASRRISNYEGKEMVMFLGTTETLAVEAWSLFGYPTEWWFIQRSNGEVRAVSWEIHRATTDELRSQLNLPLDDLVRQIREAAEERLELVKGRIGVDSPLPMLVTDANKLQELYGALGAVYEGENTTVLPPPVPGGEEPEMPPTRTGEEEPDATTIPVPGDETYPTTTDDASPENVSLGVMDRHPVSYLEEIIPPCVPLKGSEQDTCPRTPLSRARSLMGATTTLLLELPTITRSLMGSTSGGLFTPHIVVRATIKPDTTRCSVYPLAPFDYDPSRGDTWWYTGFVNYSCFMEARINEYIVGEGPPELTVTVYTRALDKSYLKDSNTVSEDDEYEANSRISAYPGKEVVMMLGPSWTTAVEAWNIQPVYHSLWFVQRSENEVRAVSEDIKITNNPELLSQMNLSLDDLVRKVKEAAEERFVLTGGRIGVDPSLPMLVTDANKLQDFYQNTGAVYEGENATVLPPPVPGGEEPELPPTRTGEEEPDATTIPAPGDETYPTTTDDASPPSSSTTITTLVQTEDTSTTTVGTSSTSTTTLPQTEDTLPTITTTTVPVPTGTTRPQVEEPVPADTSTTEALSDDTTGTTLPQVEDTLPAAAGTTVGSAPPSTGAGQPSGVGEPGEPPVEDMGPAPAGTVPPPLDDETGVPAGGDGSGVGAG